MYDKDGNGTIDLPEMIEIIGTLYDMEGVSKNTAADRARKIFGELDVDGDGELTADEFVRGCLEDPELVRLLNTGGIDGEEDDEDDEDEEDQESESEDKK